jgi:glycosyltransferase involved in cell wall biosynthesis
VSVIIPAYNYAEYLVEAIESVLAQSLRDCEIIVVDDASTDDTPEVAAYFGDRIRYTRNEVNRGLGLSRNRGLSLATGEYVAFLDADDLLLKDKLSLQVRFLDEHPEFGVAYCDTEFCSASASGTGLRFSRFCAPHSGDVLDAMSRNNFFPPVAALVRRRCLDLVGYFDDHYHPVQDWHLWIRLAQITPFRYQDRVLCRYRVHRRNVTHNRLAMSRANVRLRQWLIQSPVFSQLSPSTQGYCRLSCGVSLIKTGDLAQGRRLLLDAMRLGPVAAPASALWFLSLFGQSTFTRVETAIKNVYLRATGRHRSPLPL